MCETLQLQQGTCARAPASLSWKAFSKPSFGVESSPVGEATLKMQPPRVIILTCSCGPLD